MQNAQALNKNYMKKIIRKFAIWLLKATETNKAPQNGANKRRVVISDGSNLQRLSDGSYRRIPS